MKTPIPFLCAGLLLTAAGPARGAEPVDYALSFTGGQAVETNITGDKLAGDELSIEYWFKGTKLLSAVRIQNATLAWIVSGWGGAVGTALPAPVQFIHTSGAQEIQLATTTVVQDGRWHHVVTTYKRNNTQGFVSYVDGVATSRAATRDEPIPNIASKVYLGALGGTQEFLNGALDEVRIWKRALTDAEVAAHAAKPTRLTGRESGLIAYFPFNEPGSTTTRDLITGTDAKLLAFAAAGRIQPTDIKFAQPPFDPNVAGLWMGEVTLNKVSEAFEGAGNGTTPMPAGGQFSMNVLLHADTNGAVKLLKDVTVMQSRNVPAGTTKVVLVTDDTQLSSFDGVVKRSGKLVGVRYSSPFFSFPGDSLACAGTLGLGNFLSVTNVLAADQPTNPFRHVYHPIHKNPVDLKGDPYRIERQIEIAFNDVKLGLGEGRDNLKGTYRETVLRLHKQQLVTEGTISLQRISTVNKLNAP